MVDAPRDIARLMNTARVRLPGATDDAIQLELFTVMDDFFRGSNIWRQDIEIPVPGNDPAGTVYPITPDANCVIDKLMWVYQKSDSTNIATGPATRASMSTSGEIVLATQPSQDTLYVATVSVSVADPTSRNGFVIFPSWVLAKYRSVILDGILGKMMSQPNKPFTSTQLSVYHLRKFVSGVAQARVDAQRANLYRNQSWRFPSFVRGANRSKSGYLPPQ